MITLSAPCRALIDLEPLTVHPDDLLSDIADEVKEVHYRAAVAVDARRHPIGLDHAHRPRQPGAAPRAARRPRRAGAERARRRAGRDRRDPRPPPHRLDRDHDPGAGHVRPGRLHGDAGDRALPPERHGAEPLDRGPAARRDPLRHGHPQFSDHDRARPRGGRVPGARAGARGAGVRPRDVRQHVEPGRRGRRRDRHPRRQGVRGRRRPDDRDRAGGDRRAGPRRAPRRSCWRRWARRASAVATRCSR